MTIHKCETVWLTELFKSHGQFRVINFAQDSREHLFFKTTLLLQLIAVKAPCPRLEKALEQANAEEDKRSGEKMADYYKELTKHTGQNVSRIGDVEILYNILEIEEKHGLQLPTWTRQFYNNEMCEIAARSLALFTDNITQKRLQGGITITFT